MGKIEQFVSNMENLCNDDSHGYSWGGQGPDYDCSSSVITALKQAGFDVGNASYTGNMSSNLCARGWVRLSPDIEKIRGDILLNDADHVAVYCGNNLLAEFSQSETGGIYGQTGDQTGKEAYVHSYYNFPWDCVLRYTVSDVPDLSINVTIQPNTGAENQRWRLISKGNYYTLENKATGKVMDLAGAATVNETNIQVYPSNNTDAQLFKLIRVSDGLASYYTYEPKLTPGKLLSVANNGISANNVKIYDDLYNSKQRFWMRQESDGYYMIIHIFTLQCLSAQN